MKKLLGYVLISFGALSLFFIGIQTWGASYLTDYAHPLLKKGGYGDEKAYDFNIDQGAKIIDNVKKLFYPSSEGGKLWKFIRTIAVALFFVLLVWAGFQFISEADNPEGIKKAKLNLLYILLGATIFFLTLWLLSQLLNLETVQGVLTVKDYSIKDKANGIIIFVLGFLKALAFFAAVFFIARYGFEIITAVGEEDKIKKARAGIINVLLALIFIKVIDYIYYIAMSGEFKSKAVAFLVEASKFMAYIIGACFVLALLYAGYTMLSSTGEEERVTKAKNMVKSVFIVGILILLFMLIIHQVFNDVY